MTSIFENLINIESIDIKSSNIYIGTNAGKKIEASIKNAKKFVYIVSPYFSISKIDLLKNLDTRIDKKLILCDNSDFYSQNNLELLAGLFSYSNYQKYPEEKQKIENEKNSNIKKREQLKKVWLCSVLFTIFALGIFFYLKLYPSIYFIFLLLFLFISICGVLSSKIKIEFIENKSKETIAKLKETIIPTMEWKFDIKIIRSYYKSHNRNTPYTHLKLYLMDCPELSKNNEAVIKAFISSANFTDNGFNSNLEFLFETIDLNVTNDLINFFNDIYSGNKMEFHQFNYLVKILFERKLIKN